MSAAGLTLEEISERLRVSADAELYAINEIERLAAHHPNLRYDRDQVRRHAWALAKARQIIDALRHGPGLSIGLSADEVRRLIAMAEAEQQAAAPGSDAP